MEDKELVDVVLAAGSRDEARRALVALTVKRRNRLASLLCIGRGWDAARKSDAGDQADEILRSLFDPHRTLRMAHAASRGYAGLCAKFRAKAPALDPAVTLDAAVHVVGEGAGSGVVISASGLVATAAHVVSHGDDVEGKEVDEGLDRVGRHVVLFDARGAAMLSRCVASSEAGDVAILQILGAGPFPHAALADADARRGHKIVAVGNPFNYDLESDGEPEIEFDPPIFHTSAGSVTRYLDGDRNRTESDGLGRLVHSAWTYWGHSGCPLFSRTTGRVVGLHNSWDEDTCKRHGVAVSCVAALAGTLHRR